MPIYFNIFLCLYIISICLGLNASIPAGTPVWHYIVASNSFGELLLWTQTNKIFFFKISDKIWCFFGFNRHFHQHLIYVAFTCHTWMESCVSQQNVGTKMLGFACVIRVVRTYDNSREKSWTSIWHCLLYILESVDTFCVSFWVFDTVQSAECSEARQVPAKCLRSADLPHREPPVPALVACPVWCVV